MITPEQRGHIVMLVQSIRTSWDTRAIHAALADLQNLDMADLVHAAIRCAEDPQMRTPAAIAFLDAPHWRPTVRSTETPEQIQERRQSAVLTTQADRECPHCDEHGRQTTGFRCPHDGLSTEQRAARAAAQATAARARIRTVRGNAVPTEGAQS